MIFQNNKKTPLIRLIKTSGVIIIFILIFYQFIRWQCELFYSTPIGMPTEYRMLQP